MSFVSRDYRYLAGEAVHCEVKVDLPGKGTRWMDMRYYPYRDERSEITGAVSHGLDITVRKQAEDALRDSEEKYRSLAVNIPDIVYSFDKDRHIITINPPAEKMFGYQSKKIIGNHLSSFVYPQDRDMYSKTLMEAVKNHQKYMRGLEFRILDKTDGTRWVEMHCHNQFDEHGNFLQQDGVLRDITCLLRV
jgi:PAS domain S-box-containing protein